ncbi:MAG: hypothetical protein U1F83_08815 [Verrucomicrobiota bacterium]
MKRLWSKWMIAMVIIAVFLLIGGIYFFFDARKRAAAFASWETAAPMKVAVDFSKPGKYETDFNQTCSSSHGEMVALRIPPETLQSNSSTQLLSGLIATIEITAISATNVIESATSDIFWQTEAIDGAIPIFSISPFRKGVYRASIVVTEGASGLAGHEQILEARYLLCGLEALPAEIAKYLGSGLFVIGLVFAGIPGLVLLKRRSNLSR